MTTIKGDRILHALYQVAVTLTNSWMRRLQLPQPHRQEWGKKNLCIKYKKEILFSLGSRDAN